MMIDCHSDEGCRQHGQNLRRQLNAKASKIEFVGKDESVSMGVGVGGIGTAVPNLLSQN